MTLVTIDYLIGITENKHATAAQMIERPKSEEIKAIKETQFIVNNFSNQLNKALENLEILIERGY